MMVCPDHDRCSMSLCYHHDLHRYDPKGCTKICFLRSFGSKCVISGAKGIIDAMNEIAAEEDKGNG
jgi:hypothetical protein